MRGSDLVIVCRKYGLPPPDAFFFLLSFWEELCTSRLSKAEMVSGAGGFSGGGVG